MDVSPLRGSCHEVTQAVGQLADFLALHGSELDPEDLAEAGGRLMDVAGDVSEIHAWLSARGDDTGLADSRKPLTRRDRSRRSLVRKRARVRKEMPGGGIAAVDRAEMACDCVISSNVVDRVGDIVEPYGCDLTNYERNPVVLLQHGTATPYPIGKAMDAAGNLTVRIEPERITARLFFSRSLPEARQTFALVEEGVLSGISIGFSPTGPVGATSAGGMHFTDWELLEISVVGVPANPAAVITSRKLLECGRVAGERLRPLVRKSLERVAADPLRGVRLWVEAPHGWEPGPVAVSIKLAREAASLMVAFFHPCRSVVLPVGQRPD